MIQSLRERLTLLLLALLPLHAFLVTVCTKLVLGKGHAPLSYLAIWKEALLGGILVLALVEIFGAMQRGKREKGKGRKVDVIDMLILALLFLGVIVTVFTHRDAALAALGFRYDFIPLVAFLVARRVEWSEHFQRRALAVLLWVGVAVSAYGILTAFLPMKFFLWLGYSPAHSLYFADGPLAAFQQVSETALRRIQGTMSGPNQFGLWLLLPFSILLSLVRATRERSKEKRSAYDLLRYRRHIGGFPEILYIVCCLLIVAVLFLTFSRAAWIAAFVMAMVTLCGSVPRRLLRGVAAGAVLMVVAIAVVATLLFPSVFFRLSSSRGHLVRPLQAIGHMWSQPFGEGLGAAGPASNRVSETCVFLRPQDDPSWAKTTPRLCVFLGSTQVQPADHVCRCPFLPENWYLQIGVEMGVLGFVLFFALVVLVLRRLGTRKLGNSGTRATQQVAFLTFLGISIAALFLHAWEDSAVAYSVWLLMAMQLQPAHPAQG